MAKKTSRRLVVDASVAQSAGSDFATHTTSTDCRAVLRVALSVCHTAVFSSEITSEWDKHQSVYAREWRVLMESRRKVVKTEKSSWQTRIHAAIHSTLLNQKDIAAALKDAHLVDAALQADGLIISSDDVAKSLFVHVSENMREIGHLIWLNPNCDKYDVLEWLKSGAKDRRALRLAP